jgi:hypothetical protein
LALASSVMGSLCQGPRLGLVLYFSTHLQSNCPCQTHPAPRHRNAPLYEDQTRRTAPSAPHRLRLQSGEGEHLCQPHASTQRASALSEGASAIAGPTTIGVRKSREDELLPRGAKSPKARFSTAAERLRLAHSGWRTAPLTSTWQVRTCAKETIVSQKATHPCSTSMEGSRSQNAAYGRTVSERVNRPRCQEALPWSQRLPTRVAGVEMAGAYLLKAACCRSESDPSALNIGGRRSRANHKAIAVLPTAKAQLIPLPRDADRSHRPLRQQSHSEGRRVRRPLSRRVVWNYGPPSSSRKSSKFRLVVRSQSIPNLGRAVAGPEDD